MAKLTNTELKALAEQLTQKLTEAESKRYNIAKEVFDKQHRGVVENFKKQIESLGALKAIEVSYGYGEVHLNLENAPERKHFQTSDILNRLIIKQIDIKDVTDLMKAVEKDLK